MKDSLRLIGLIGFISSLFLMSVGAWSGNTNNILVGGFLALIMKPDNF